MKIAILGTRGIPNNYGGFEQITAWLSAGLCDRGHEVTVYNPHHHPWQEKKWGEVKIEHCYDPEFLSTAGQFIYDFNCILDARKKDFDVVLFMGYTSSSIWHRLFPRNAVIVSNMDGLEWRRSKYSRPVQRFLRYAEKLAVKHSDFHIADSTLIRDYLSGKYGIRCCYIPYGASCGYTDREDIFDAFSLRKSNYFMLMARMEPENNIDLVLDGFRRSNSEKSLAVVGNTNNGYGRAMEKKYRSESRIVFTGSLFDQDIVHTLRKHSSLYFHGHSVGGTNPSLLEAMASRTAIAAHDNEFNRGVLGEDAFYFSSARDIKTIIETPQHPRMHRMKENNMAKIENIYKQKNIIDQYEHFLLQCCEKTTNEKIVYQQRYAYK